MSRGAGAKKSAQSTRDFIKSALGSTEREPGWEYGQILPVRARKNEEGGMEREWGLGYSNTAKGMLDAFTLPHRAMQGEEVTPEQVMEMAMNITAPGVAAARYAPGVLNMPMVYHGTPHRFDPTPDNPLGEFRAAQIGTGEGAQMYGHGIYVAESPSVAEQYKIMTAADKYDTSSGVIRSSDLVDKIFKKLGDVPKQLESSYWAKANEAVSDLIMGKSASEIANEIRTSKYGRTYGALADAVEELAPKAVQGNFYTADLPDEIADRMLDWDKPMSEQIEVLRKAFSKSGAVDTSLEEGLSGEDFYRSIAKVFDDPSLEKALGGGKSGKIRASEYLQSVGIPGIKYLDEFSRGAGEGTRNFVLFPGEEKKAKILKRD